MPKYGPPPKPLADRFWSKVNKTDGCWLWKASTNGKYGVLGAVNGRTQSAYAHRLSWELAFGPIPGGALVCHHCDTPLCVRPDHLFLGSVRDNHSDCARKGRRRGRGSPPEIDRPEWVAGREAIAQAKLAAAIAREAQRLEVVALGPSTMARYVEMARRFGVSVSKVRRTALGQGGKWLTPSSTPATPPS